MKKIGIISYNIYGNFTNYGSALQSWALAQVIGKYGYNPILVDYCPDIHLDKNILNPLEKMWDQDEASIKNTQLTLPAIEENYYKFEKFFNYRFNKTDTKYNKYNFGEINREELDGFICGSDTIFCIDESNGFDEAYFANYPCMKQQSIAYAASFGDTSFASEDYETLNQRIHNFKAIGLRESKMVKYVKGHTTVPVKKTIDPTLLLYPEEYTSIVADRVVEGKYLLLYSRRFNPQMQAYAEEMADKNGWKIVEISLRATNEKKGHIMMYKAGVEEFLSLIKNAEYVVTNSFHGLMFGVQFKKQFAVFSRETGDSKISEALDLFGLSQNLLTDKADRLVIVENYENVHDRIEIARKESLDFLKKELSLL